MGELNTTRDWLDGLANQIAEEHDLLNHGQVGELIGHYLFTRKPGKKKSKTDKLKLTTKKSGEEPVEESEELLEKLKSHPDVEYYAPQGSFFDINFELKHNYNNLNTHPHYIIYSL